MVCVVGLLHGEASSDYITTALVQIHQSSFFINVVIKTELGSDPQIRSWWRWVLQSAQCTDEHMTTI